MNTSRMILGTAAGVAVAIGGGLAAAPASRAATTSTAHTAVAAKASSTCTHLRTIKQGSTGYEVVKLQKYLNKLRQYHGNFAGYTDYPKLKTDGIFGKATKNATESIQAFYELKDDGVVGPRTWYAFTDGTCKLSAL